jgi:transposase
MPKPLRKTPLQSNEIRAPRTQGRRQFSAADKGRILQAADACVHGQLGALLRQEGVYHSQLKEWRAQLLSGLAARKPGPAPKLDAKDVKILKLDKQIAALKKELLIVNGLVELQKKAQEIFSAMQPGEPACIK